MSDRARHETPPPDRWQRIHEVLAAAIECEAGERGALLAEACDGDAALRDEVESLLAAHETQGPIDRLADEVAPVSSWARSQALGWEGRRIAQYVVMDALGAGGMGVVYKAHDERLGRRVALKFLPPHLSTLPEAKQRFVVEARAAAALDHPAICTIYEIGETDDGQLFIAMPLYDGETIKTILDRDRLPFDEALPIALQVARGLGRAHEHGIVHRDIKPSNVVRLSDGTVKILDFGIAKMDDVALTGREAPFGTIAYMSPEHLRGEAVDHRADIWSLGILLHEMLTGTRPFRGESRTQLVDAILTWDPELMATSHPDVPAGIDDLLRKALAKTPDRRYRSMTSLSGHLAAIAAAEGIRVGSDAADERPWTTTLEDESVAVPAGGERRRATVLVSTVSDYGALVERLTLVEADRLIAAIRDMAVEIVRRHGGLVNQAIGEELVSVFGVPVAHEDDELRAVRAAMELHARVRELIPCRIQSGLHAGMVVAQRLNEGPRRYGIIGSPVQVASRLAAMAGADRVLLSPECHRLVAPFVQTQACAPVALQPEGEPVTPFRVTGETGLETRLEASERAGLTPYIGRQSELAKLEAQLARAHGGEGRLVVVVGEAGAGKSRLLYELRDRVAAAHDIRVLHGRCRAYGGIAPYSPFVEILRDALGVRGLAICSPNDTVARIRAIDSSLEPYLPLYLHLLSVRSETHALPRHLQGEHLQAAMLDALAALVTALAASAAVVVLLEDWHWADAASREALRHLVAMVTAHRLLLVVTSRPDPGALGEWTEGSARIHLEPLDFGASLGIMHAIFRVTRVQEALARRVHERTGGNPFFLEQLCSALLEQEAVTVVDGEAAVQGHADALSLPDTAQAVIRTRLDNLDPDARAVVRVAAVIGREFEHALVAEALGPEVDLARAVDRLKASGLIQQSSVVPEVGYRFRHVLTQEVSYESLLGHQRTTLHGMIGRAIEARHPDRLDEKAAMLAHHFGRAESWREAVRYGRRAAERASALSQFADALATCDQVEAWLEHFPDEDDRRDLTADLLLQQERVCETLGLRGRQQQIIGHLIARLAPQGPSTRLAQAYLRQGDLLTLLKRFSAADRALSTSLRISREQGDAAVERDALRSIGLLRWHEGRHTDALAITESALAIDRECGDDIAVAVGLTNLGNILKSMGEHGRALARLEEALAMPALAQDPKKQSYALHSLANVHRSLGDLARALDCLRQANATARAHLLPIQRSFHLTSIAHIELQEGRIDAALATYEEAVELSRRARHADGLVQSLRMLGEVLFGLGKHDQALPFLREAAHLFAQLEDRASEAEMWSRVAAILERTSSAEAAETWVTVRSLRQSLGEAKGELEALEGLARVARDRASSPGDAISAFEAALTLASTLREKRRELALRNALGMLEWDRGGYAEALRHYEAALLLVRDLDDRVHEGLILNSVGVTLSRLHRPEEARTALEESVALNRQTGERLLEAHALAALGQVSHTGDRLEEAVRCFEQSLALRRALGDRQGEGWMWLRLAETRAAAGDEAGAREAAEAAATVSADLNDAELARACERVTPRLTLESEQE